MHLELEPRILAVYFAAFSSYREIRNGPRDLQKAYSSREYVGENMNVVSQSVATR